MTKKGSQSNSDHQLIQLLKDKLEKVERRLEEIENKNKKLEEKVVVLESEKAINQNVTRLLSEEVDRLDQYHRRSNIIIANVIKQEHESQEEVTNKINEIIQRDLNLPEVIPEIDKLHRVGKVRERNGKQTQDIIVRFRTHAARYQVYDNRKRTSNVKIRPNLTKRRDQLRYEATELVNDNNQVNFVYSDAHGDIKIRLNNQFKGKYVYEINSLEELKDILEKINV